MTKDNFIKISAEKARLKNLTESLELSPQRAEMLFAIQSTTAGEGLSFSYDQLDEHSILATKNDRTVRISFIDEVSDTGFALNEEEQVKIAEGQMYKPTMDRSPMMVLTSLLTSEIERVQYALDDLKAGFLRVWDATSAIPLHEIDQLDEFCLLLSIRYPEFKLVKSKENKYLGFINNAFFEVFADISETGEFAEEKLFLSYGEYYDRSIAPKLTKTVQVHSPYEVFDQLWDAGYFNEVKYSNINEDILCEAADSIVGVAENVHNKTMKKFIGSSLAGLMEDEIIVESAYSCPYTKSPSVTGKIAMLNEETGETEYKRFGLIEDAEGEQVVFSSMPYDTDNVLNEDYQTDWRGQRPLIDMDPLFIESKAILESQFVLTDELELIKD